MFGKLEINWEVKNNFFQFDFFVLTQLTSYVTPSNETLQECSNHICFCMAKKGGCCFFNTTFVHVMK